MINDQLNGWRDTLNIIDESIIALLGQRYKICRKVGELKKQNNIPMMQSDRVKEVIDRCMLLGRKADVPENLIEKLYQLIIEEACAMQIEIINR